MVYYLKINRKNDYTYLNLQRWLDIASLDDDAFVYIICDDSELKARVMEKVIYPTRRTEFIPSVTDNEDLMYIVDRIADDNWKNVAYAHLTTFLHASDNNYSQFWNIDADDTFFCLSAERTLELLNTAREYACDNHIGVFSLDMWRTKTQGKHWSFGITYTDGNIDWIKKMKKYASGGVSTRSDQPRNLDGFFSLLRDVETGLIETFYVENLRFIHYSNDFIRRPWASGFFHWREGQLYQPILADCFGFEFGCEGIPGDIIELDIGISDEESKIALIDTCYSSCRNQILERIQ